MRREIIFAIIAGILFGLILAFGLFRANRAIQVENQPKDIVNEVENTTPISNEVKLSIVKPNQFSVITANPLNITGLSGNSNWIALSTKTNDIILRTSSAGSFETNIELVGGINSILITAFNSFGNTIEKIITPVFSTEFSKNLEKTPTESEESPSSTDSETLITEKVKEKLENAKTVPYSYIGTITDLTDISIQIESGLQKIKQISIDESTTYINEEDNSVLSFEDVALGDYIVAMGFVNEDDVLEAVRILISSPPEALSKNAHMGIVEEVEKKKLVLVSNSEGNKITFVLNNFTKVNLETKNGDVQTSSISDIEIDQNIIVIGEIDDGVLYANLVQILP